MHPTAGPLNRIHVWLFHVRIFTAEPLKERLPSPTMVAAPESLVCLWLASIWY
jgi:hypothetical protein